MPRNSETRFLTLERLRTRLWLVLAICIVLGFICVQFHAPPFVPLLDRGGWVVATGFFENSRPATSDVDASILNSPEAQFFRSWKPGGGTSIDGELRSQPFRAPEILIIPFTGYPIEPGVHLAIRCVESAREMPIATGNAHEYWVQRILRIQPTFCAGPIQIVASNRSDRFYVGVGTPFAGSRWHLVKNSVFTLIYLHALAFGLVVLPVVVLAQLARRFRIAQGQEWLAGVAALGLLAYAMFFLLQASKVAAVGVSLGFYAACLFVGVRALAAQGITRANKRMRDWRLPILFAFSLFCVLLLEMVDVGAGTWNAAYRFLPAIWSSDHIWPRIVADGLWSGQRASNIFVGWHVSDRPPLMAGVLLLIHPIADLLGPRAAARGLAHLLPKTAGIIANAAIALPVIEVLVFSRGAPRRPRWMLVTAVLLVLTSPFIIFNTIYTWPKLLSAFFAMSATLVLARNSGPSAWRDVPLAGVLFGLALLSHAGVAFGLIAVPLAVRATCRRWRMRETVAAAFLAGLCWLPWSYWQKHVDPPGNALLKFVFTGSYGFDDQQTSVAETVRTFAANLTWHRWLDQKWLAVKTLFGFDYHVGWIDPHVTTRIGALRLQDFLFVVPSLRFLGIAVTLAALLALWQRKRGEGLRAMALWLACAVSGIGVTLLVMWGDHINHVQSYFSLVALLLAAGFAILALPRKLMILLVVAQVIYVSVVWILEPIWIHGNVSVLTAAGALAALGLTTIELIRFTNNPHSAQ